MTKTDPIDTLTPADKQRAEYLRMRFIGKLNPDLDIYDRGCRDDDPDWGQLNAVGHVSGEILRVLNRTCEESADGFETAIMALAVKIADLSIAHPARRAVWAALAPIIDQMVEQHASDHSAASRALR